jgi:hypothetical protein
MISVFAKRYAQPCARHSDLVAVHEAPDGTIALLLRHTLVPLPEEHAAWERDTREVARDVTDDLRNAGFAGDIVVAQWLPMHRLAHIFDTWPRCWEGDPARAAQLRHVARRVVADDRFLAWHTAERRRRRRPRARPGPASIDRWYCALAPHWLGLEPRMRRELVLQTHVWIIERALAPDVCPPPAADLVPNGALVHRLERLVPPDDLTRWRPWIAVVLRALARALERVEAGGGPGAVRSLFLVPSRVPPPIGHRAVLRAL